MNTSDATTFDFPHRLDQPELLDLGHGTDSDVAENLAEMWRTNRYLGGLRAITRHLYPRLAAMSGTATVLDLGTGSAAVPVAIMRWSQRHGRSVSFVGVDWAPRNLTVARRLTRHAPGIRLVRADAAHLPLAPLSVDFAISSLFIHHLTPPQVIRVLRAAFDATRQRLIMSDAVRGQLPLFFFKLGEPIFARNYLTRHDGELSIQRSYTPAELLQLAEAAGLPTPKVYTHWLWRMTLVVDR